MQTADQHWEVVRARQKAKGVIWDERNRDPYAYIPMAMRGKISQAAALTANVEEGRFAVEYLVEHSLHFAKFDLAYHCRNGRMKPFQQYVVQNGIGKCFDTDWIVPALEATLVPVWVDVSHVSCDMAQGVAMSQLAQARAQGITTHKLSPKKIIKEASGEEIVTFPERFGIDLTQVHTWFLHRYLNCLTEEEAAMELSMIGRSLSEEWDPHKEHRIIVINALRDENPGVEEGTSHMPRQSLLERCIEEGAGRRVKSRFRLYHQYLNKKVTAQTFTAR